MSTYEQILNEVSALKPAPASGIRDIRWLTPSNVIGVCRDQTEHLEVFLAGTALAPQSAKIREAMQFHSWHRDGAPQLEANRLLLPAFGHYDQVGALICAELLRCGVDDDLDAAFAKTEPLMSLAVERLELSHSMLIGLAGELLLLEALCRLAEDSRVPLIVSSWDGWRRSHRDLTLDGTGVEVKTTQRGLSSHSVQGFHQVERADGSDGNHPEDRLILVSIGLQAVASGSNAITIPLIVQRIVDRMSTNSAAGQVAAFLERVAIYGSETGFGYRHATMAHDAPFDTPFLVTFVRGYDMDDPAIEVLRQDDVATRHHVDARSVRFDINLPTVGATDNPISGLNQVATLVLNGP